MSYTLMRPTDLDADDCPRCGDPLPVDRKCDCAGTDIDASLPRNRTLGRRLKLSIPREDYLRASPNADTDTNATL